MRYYQLARLIITINIIYLTFVFGTLMVSSAQTSTIQTPIQSVFVKDTCAPPCWFGITPGISTAADVQNTFQKHAEFFDFTCPSCDDPNGGEKLSQGIIFKWKEYDRKDILQFSDIPTIIQWPSSVSVSENDIVDHMRISINRYIFLSDVLSKLGKPDLAYLGEGRQADDFNSSRLLLLVYISMRLRVYLWTFPTTICNAATVQQDFNADFLIYYSTEEAVTLLPPNVLNITQTEPLPQLLTPIGRQIRGEQWEQFINSEGYDQCEDFYTSLPTDFIVPTLLWPSPTLTPVAEATP